MPCLVGSSPFNGGILEVLTFIVYYYNFVARDATCNLWYFVIYVYYTKQQKMITLYNTNINFIGCGRGTKIEITFYLKEIIISHIKR